MNFSYQPNDLLLTRNQLHRQWNTFNLRYLTNPSTHPINLSPLLHQTINPNPVLNYSYVDFSPYLHFRFIIIIYLSLNYRQIFITYWNKSNRYQIKYQTSILQYNQFIQNISKLHLLEAQSFVYESPEAGQHQNFQKLTVLNSLNPLFFNSNQPNKSNNHYSSHKLVVSSSNIYKFPLSPPPKTIFYFTSKLFMESPSTKSYAKTLKHEMLDYLFSQKNETVCHEVPKIPVLYSTIFSQGTYLICLSVMQVKPFSSFVPQSLSFTSNNLLYRPNEATVSPSILKEETPAVQYLPFDLVTWAMGVLMSIVLNIDCMRLSVNFISPSNPTVTIWLPYYRMSVILSVWMRLFATIYKLLGSIVNSSPQPVPTVKLLSSATRDVRQLLTKLSSCTVLKVDRSVTLRKQSWATDAMAFWCPVNAILEIWQRSCRLTSLKL